MKTPSPKLSRSSWLLPVILMSGLAGCGGSGPEAGLPPKPIPVANPRPNDPLKDVTLENESANMDKIKKAGAAK